MKLRSGVRIFLPVLLLAMAALLACGDDSNQNPAPVGLIPTLQPVEPARPFTQEELAAVDLFEQEKQGSEEAWDQFYQDFDSWRTGLTSCHPSSAQEALRELAASFTALTEHARSLPRTSSTYELADLLIAATDAGEAALRQLRDRWQAGNITLLEMVEQRRTESALAQNTVVDMSLALQQELRDRPTPAQIGEMEAFSESFDAIADAWDDFHDSYAAFARRESRLEEEDVAAGYEELVEQLGEIVGTIEELTATEINDDMIDTLEDAAEDELALLAFLAEFPPEFETSDQDPTDTTDAVAQSLSAPAQMTVPTATPGAPSQGAGEETAPQTAQKPTQETPATASKPAPTAGPASASAAEEETEVLPREELLAAIEETEANLAGIEQAIEEFIEDDSAVQLEDLQDFDRELARFVENWSQFYEVFTEWRATDGGCDRVEVAADLTGFSQQAGELAGAVRDLPQSGPLVSVYGLMVEAAEREADAFRTLASGWTPFAVDVFKAVDDERVSAGRLRRQAGIALEDLKSRQ